MRSDVRGHAARHLIRAVVDCGRQRKDRRVSASLDGSLCGKGSWPRNSYASLRGACEAEYASLIVGSVFVCTVTYIANDFYSSGFHRIRNAPKRIVADSRSETDRLHATAHAGMRRGARSRSMAARAHSSHYFKRILLKCEKSQRCLVVRAAAVSLVLEAGHCEPFVLGTGHDHDDGRDARIGKNDHGVDHGISFL